MVGESIEGSVYLVPNTLASPREDVLEFQKAVGDVRVTPPGVLDVEKMAATSPGSPDKTLTQGCVDQVEEIVARDWNRRWYVDSQESAATMHGLQKVLISRTSIGETSAHQVFFARLTGAHHGVRVAVKPFRDEPMKAIREWTNIKLAQQRGLKVFRPFAFLIAERGYLVTERQDGIDPMDNVNWVGVLASPEDNQGALRDLQKIGPALARIHDRGCYHGDVQMKNIVITQTGSVNLHDWEAATFMHEGLEHLSNSERESTTRRKAVHDLKVLFGSLARGVEEHGVGLLHGLTAKAQHSYFQELILHPYIEERLRLLDERSETEHLEAAYQHIGEVESEIAEFILDATQNTYARSHASKS